MQQTDHDITIDAGTRSRPDHNGPPLWPILVNASASAPPAMRRRAWMVAAVGILLIALQFFESSDTEGVAGAAEFASAALGIAGGVMVAAVVFLGRAAKQARFVDEIGDPLARRRVLLVLPALAVSAATLVAAAIALMAVRGWLGAEPLFVVVMTAFYGGLLVFAVRTVMQSTSALYVHAAAEAAAAADAKAAARDAEIAALQARMNPHFLFNALNTVAALVRSDPASAERATEDLSTVLRMTLERTASRMSPLEEEIDYARAYAGLEQARWGDRLEVEWQIDPATLRLEVLPLVVQPLLENAIRHGLGSRARGGTIRIGARIDAEHVVLTVEDDGPGWPPLVTERTGLGNLRQRLRRTYGGRASMQLDRLDTGARVIVRIPVQEAECAS